MSGIIDAMLKSMQFRMALALLVALLIGGCDASQQASDSTTATTATTDKIELDPRREVIDERAFADLLEQAEIPLSYHAVDSWGGIISQVSIGDSFDIIAGASFECQLFPSAATARVWVDWLNAAQSNNSYERAASLIAHRFLGLGSQIERAGNMVCQGGATMSKSARRDMQQLMQRIDSLVQQHGRRTNDADTADAARLSKWLASARRNTAPKLEPNALGSLPTRVAVLQLLPENAPLDVAFRRDAEFVLKASDAEQVTIAARPRTEMRDVGLSGEDAVSITAADDVSLAASLSIELRRALRRSQGVEEAVVECDLDIDICPTSTLECEVAGREPDARLLALAYLERARSTLAQSNPIHGDHRYLVWVRNATACMAEFAYYDAEPDRAGDDFRSRIKTLRATR